MRRAGPPRGEWTPAERRVLDGLSSPGRIQAFLDSIDYSEENAYRCPRQVLSERKGHCFDGALFAAAALRRLGHAPRIVDMVAVRDDDHIIAVFQSGRGWGAVAKSNMVGLRYREPVYRSLRELVMSYFEQYYNLDGERTLRSYSQPLDLSRLDAIRWQFETPAIDEVAERLEAVRHHAVLSPAQVRRLLPVDRRSYEAGLLGSNPRGLYQPPPRRSR